MTTNKAKEKNPAPVSVDYSEGINSLTERLIQSQQIVKEIQELLHSNEKQEYFVRRKGTIRLSLLEAKSKVKSLSNSLALLLEVQKNQNPTK